MSDAPEDVEIPDSFSRSIRQPRLRKIRTELAKQNVSDLKCGTLSLVRFVALAKAA